MKRISKILIIVFLFSSFSYADWISEARKKSEIELKPLVRDVGASLGGGMYGPVRGGGLFAFNVGIQSSFSKVSEETKALNIFSSDTEYISSPWLYLSKGIPGGFNLFLRIMNLKIEDSDEKLSLFGVGVEYKIIKDAIISPVPGLSVLIARNALDSSFLKVKTTTFAVKASKKLPFITPFIAIARDKTEMEVESLVGTLNPDSSYTRFVLGIEFRLIPFTYINLAFSNVNSNTGFQLGLGVKY